MSVEISVIIPTYKRPKLLIKCLKALLVQKFDKTRYEIIVVSDGAGPETKKIFDELAGYGAPVLKYFAMPQKKGPAAARNYGWMNASGRIIAFTDDDCIPDNFWLNEISKHFDIDAEAAITGKVIVPVGKRPTDHERNTAGLQTADFITANCACTKKALEVAGGFDEQFSMAWREDSDLEFKFISNNIPVTHIESAIVVHPVRKAKWGVSIKEQKKTMFNALLYKKYPGLYRKKIQSQPPVLYYAILAAFLVMLGGLFLHNRQAELIGLVIWLGLTAYFIYKRLSDASLSVNHITEMIVTSVFIPFISLYWQWYGAIKYRVWFL